MNYLKTYKIYEDSNFSDLKEDLKDIVLELEDDNFECNIDFNEKNEKLNSVNISISKKESWNLKNIDDVIVRVVNLLYDFGLYPSNLKSKIETALISSYIDKFKNRIIKIGESFVYNIKFSVESDLKGEDEIVKYDLSKKDIDSFNDTIRNISQWWVYYNDHSGFERYPTKEYWLVIGDVFIFSINTSNNEVLFSYEHENAFIEHFNIPKSGADSHHFFLRQSSKFIEEDLGIEYPISNFVNVNNDGFYEVRNVKRNGRLIEEQDFQYDERRNLYKIKYS